MRGRLRRLYWILRPRQLAGWQRSAAVVAALGLLVAAVGVVAHFRAPGSALAIGISAAAPYLLTGAPVATVLLLLARQWAATLAAVVMTLVCITTQAPLFRGAGTPPHASSFTVLTFNLKLGSAAPGAVVAAVRSRHADVLMLEELTPEEQNRLDAAGLNTVLPHHLSAPAQSATGTGLWSRTPLTSTRTAYPLTFRMVTARTTPAGSSRPIVVAALHLAGPVPSSILWQHDIHRLPALLGGLGSSRIPVVVGGDFNATPDVAQFRALLVHGYSNAADQAGSGYTPTYPAGRPYPPLIEIDHVLTRNATADAVSSVAISSSDHRALSVDVDLPSR